MNNNFEHLEIPLVFSGKPKYNGGGDPNPLTVINRQNRNEHGNRIRGQSQELSRFWNVQIENRVAQNLPTIDSGVPIMLEIEPDIDIEFLRGFGLEIVSEIENGFILVSSVDVNLNKLNQQLELFIADSLQTPAKVYGLKNNNERMEKIMSPSLREKWNTIMDNQNYLVELSISCNGGIVMPKKPVKNNEETDEHYTNRLTNWQNKYNNNWLIWDELAIERENEIQELIDFYNGNIQDILNDTEESSVRFPDSFTIKVSINGKGLKDIVANYPFIFEVVLVEDIVVAHTAESSVPLDLTNVNIIPPENNSPIIGIIDSGIQENYLLSPALFESISYVADDHSTDDKVDEGGHGTRVAGIALTNNLEISEELSLPFRLRNIRVLDESNTLRAKLVGPKLISDIIKRYNLNSDNKTRIFNHSIGERKECELVHMTSLAAVIDKYSYENDILFIQSAGNITEETIANFIENGDPYPNYLDNEISRICDPAQSLQALTVGSVSHQEFNNGDILGLGKEQEISSFSRTGPGIWDSIKPDVVEYGGTHALKFLNGIAELSTPEELCIKSPRKIIRNRIFAKDVIGTSFSTPKVTSIAAALESIFPNASTLLYRGLIVQSAKWPQWAYECDDKSKVLRKIGYGIPSYESATRNNEYRVTLFSDKMSISANDAHVYKVPIPESLRNIGEEYEILVEITLSYNANPRRTRRGIKGYLSTWLEWSSSRLNEDYETFKNRIFETGRRDDLDEGDLTWTIGSQRNFGQAENFSKKLNTVQKDWSFIQSNQLPEDFCVAVRAHKGWGEGFPANYALIVTFDAINKDYLVYNEIRQTVEIELENNRVQIEIDN